MRGTEFFKLRFFDVFISENNYCGKILKTLKIKSLLACEAPIRSLSATVDGAVSSHSWGSSTWFLCCDR